MYYGAMGKQTVRFNCIHCGHCCTDVVCLPTPWDVIRIVRETGADPYKFLVFIGPDDISEVSKSDPTWLEVKGRRYLMALRRSDKGCYFIDKRTRYCRIYEHRPILCRLYPCAVHETRGGKFKSFSLHKDVGCPRDRGGSLATQPLYDLYVDDQKHQQDYADLVSFFNARVPGVSRPDEFLQLFLP